MIYPTLEQIGLLLLVWIIFNIIVLLKLLHKMNQRLERIAAALENRAEAAHVEAMVGMVHANTRERDRKPGQT